MMRHALRRSRVCRKGMPDLTRRRLLKGLAALPLASGLTLRPALAQGAPRKVIFFYIPDGCIPSLWHPTGSEFDFDLPPMTAPLESVKSDCVFLSGLTMYGGGGTHEGGVRKVLTGNSSLSLDVFLGEQLAGETPVSSLFLGVAGTHQNGSKYFSHLPGGISRTSQDNPVEAFTSLFGDTSSDPGGGLNPQLSVLDSAMADLEDLRGGLGDTERAKLDLHLEALREVENRIAASQGGTCPTSTFNPEGFSVPEGWHGYPPVYNREENFELVGRLQMDLTVLALACGMTRVAGLQWSHAVSPTSMAWTGSSQRHHDASHYGNPGSTTAANFVLLKRWYAEQLRYLIEELRSRPDGDGTLLDNTLIFVFSELGDSNRHDHKNMPFLLAGGAGGALSTGRYLDYGGDAHSKLLVDIANMMGVNIDTFGYSGHGTGGLSGLFDT